MTNEQLQAENNDLKNDMKLVKNICFELAAIVGMVNNEGVLDPNFTVKKAMAEVTSIITSTIMPNPFSTKKVLSLDERFKFLKSILPLYNKYKDL